MKRRKNNKRRSGQVDITGARAVRVGLPPLARRYLEQWRAAHPGEDLPPVSPQELFVRSGSNERMARLVSLMLCMSDVLSSVADDYRDLCMGWNAWTKGLQPATNGALNGLKRLCDVLHGLSFHSGGVSSDERGLAQLRYAEDFDRLRAIVYEFGGMPVRWQMGEPVELKPAEPAVAQDAPPEEGRLSITFPVGGSCTIGRTVRPDHRGRLITRYSICRLDTALGRGDVVRQCIATLAGARRIAIALTRTYPDNVYIIYRDEHLAVGNHTLTPVDYVHRNHTAKQ